jgi:hypothetical protein
MKRTLAAASAAHIAPGNDPVIQRHRFPSEGSICRTTRSGAAAYGVCAVELAVQAGVAIDHDENGRHEQL